MLEWLAVGYVRMAGCWNSWLLGMLLLGVLEWLAVGHVRMAGCWVC